jgi:hypothetical protein
MKGKKFIETGYYNINNTWRIDRDRMNFILQRKGAKIEGKEGSQDTWQIVGFYQTFKQIYHELVERSIKEVSLTDMKAVNEKIEELHTLIEDAHAKGIMSQEK